MADHSRARLLAGAIFGTLVLLRALAPVQALGTTTDPALAAGPPASERIHALASFGGAIGGIGGYQGYGLGLLARAGVELPLFHAGGTGHALVVTVEGGRFSAWALDTPFLFRGVQLDLASLRTDWRLYPWRGLGLYVEGGSGLLLARDRIAMMLPTREVSSTEMRLGVPLELGTGWVVADHVDVSLRYTQIVFAQKAPASFGFMQLALGIRL